VRFLVAISLAVLGATAALAQSDPFQSNPGPTATPARPAPRAARPTPEPDQLPATTVPTPVGRAPALNPYDGRYIGTSRSSTGCSEDKYEMVVAGGRVSGSGTDGQRTWWVSGVVAGDGSFNGIDSSAEFTGRFQDGLFQSAPRPASNPSCGQRVLTLRRTAGQ
jgi:hypothetical protein